ncbi:MAG: NAD(P)H-dependent oxidoreductase, partial [Proteobacteria bacterium]
MSKVKIAVIVGSLRRESFSRKLAQALVKEAPDTLEFTFVNLFNLEVYNQDLDDDGQPPATWAAFRETMKAAQGVLFVTPEYNRSIPSLVKNAIDIGSRPYGKSVWDKKPAAVVSQSPGAIGGFGANHHLRQCLVFLNMPVLQQPEAYLGNIASFLGEDGLVPEQKNRDFLKAIMGAYGQWVAKN